MFDDAREVARQAAVRNDEIGLIEGQRVERSRRSRWLPAVVIGLAVIGVIVLLILR
jgi:hypothetical protein